MENHSIHKKASSFQIYWLYGLIISFCYEIPIVNITQYERVNPRLFDIMFLVGVTIILPSLKQNMQLPKLYILWRRIVIVFCICAFIWALFILPWEYGKYSLFFAFKYLQGLICLYIASKIPLTISQKKTIHHIVIYGGMFVALYCIPEYFFSFSSSVMEVEIAPGKYLTYVGGTLLGPFSATYFHLAMFSSLAASMAFAYILVAHGLLRKIGYLALALFISWPALFCGSRAGIGLTLISFVILIFWIKDNSSNIPFFAISFAILITLFVSIGFKHSIGILNKNSYTFERLKLYDFESENNIYERLMKFRDYGLNKYKWEGLSVPFIGAGFYVAPVYIGGAENYRVGYGVHNSYLFAFEQGGIAAFTFFLVFLINAFILLKKIRKDDHQINSVFASAMLAYFIAQLIVAFAGVIFWQGHNTGNFSTFGILLLLIATHKPQEKEDVSNFFKPSLISQRSEHNTNFRGVTQTIL